jgi:hypothetical protein
MPISVWLSRPARPSSTGVVEGLVLLSMDDEAIRALVTRLSRPHPSGGDVIERAAILAEGAHSTAVVGWIIAHHGTQEAAVVASSNRGLHGSRLNEGVGAEQSPPLRYVLPAGTLV